MLSPHELTALYRDHRDRPVLSVYLDASQTDPAQRSAWHTRFRDLTRELRRSLEAESMDVDAFDRAVQLIESRLGNPDGFLKGRGWVSFAQPDGVLYAEGVPVPMPDLVRWESGIRVAPYLRALKQSRPVAAAIVDSRRARLFRYEAGELEETVDLRADQDFGDLADTAGSKRASTSSGMRGETGRDRGQALIEKETTRFLGEVADKLRAFAGEDGLVVLGGPGNAVSSLRKLLDGEWAERVIVRPRLSFDRTSAEIKGEVEEGASSWSRERQASLVDEVLDAALSGGAACLGVEETERAVKERRARTLLISDAFRRADPDRADRMAGTAFDGGATAIEVPTNANPRLDEEAGGVAALLHYRT